MVPLVIVKSFGSEKSIDIIKKTARCGGQENLQVLPAIQTDNTITTYVYDVITKYYKTEIGLFTYDDDLESVPAHILDSVEAALFFMDVNDITWHSNAKSICKFVDRSRINTTALITHHLDENQLVDLMMELKTNYESFNFDIIDLSAHNSANAEDDGGDNANNEMEVKSCDADDNCYQFAEVFDFLNNNIWSNVEYPEPDHPLVDFEENLSNFEDLLNKVKVFKATSEFLSRSELLNKAEKLAELFASIIDEDMSV